jgi:8-oxo-dGTP pyrophosphatase MutT (NUDIX family)
MQDTITQIRFRLANHQRRVITGPGLIPAAVLMPLFDKDGAAHFLLTLRTHKVDTHKGQISFPGGGWEAGDRTIHDTALRESYEEVGIRPEDVQIIGELDDVIAVSDHLVTPVVATIPHPYSFVVSEHEIEELIEIPLSFFMDLKNCRIEERSHRGQTVPVYFYNYNHHVVWGLTAHMIRSFLKVCFDLPHEAAARM